MINQDRFKLGVVRIDHDEWWFNGRIIQKNDHPKLKGWASFDDNLNNTNSQGHFTFQEAIFYCMHHPCIEPKHYPKDYLS